LVEILIETIPTFHFFVPKQNSGWKRFKIDPKVGTSFPYINSHGRPSTKNSGENVKEIREIRRGSSEKRTRTVFHCPTITDNLYFICVDYLTYEGSFVVFSYSDVAIN